MAKTEPQKLYSAIRDYPTPVKSLQQCNTAIYPRCALTLWKDTLSEPGALERTSALPTGTVTFLFSDIEGSSQRWEMHRDAMQIAVARHEQILTDAITRNGGYVFKTIGDAFCAAFSTAPDAVRSAALAQLALAKEDFSAVGGLRVRMGLHTGYAEERNSDYFGPAVNRVARLMSIGHGGQVLVSGATRELAHSDLPRGTSLFDLGSHQLRDLSEPEQVWQLNIDGLPSQFPPLRSLDTLPNNLPRQVKSFFGRERDLEELKTLITKHQLVTLVGSGGVGKTRLALQTGAELLDRYPDGVWFADLATITDPEVVSSVVAQVLGMTQQEGKRVDESIPPYLKRKKLLLILDNCEHVLAATADIAKSIIRTCNEVRLVCTSRQALGISGEQIVRLRSLEVPHRIDEITPAGVMEYGAVALFVDRARSVDISFALTSDTAAVVTDICRRLDGIPLAIELAAARVKVLSIPNLAQRLNERFKLLTGGSRDAVPRQKTLSALIDWSYDLLAAQEQSFFSRLGIFAGGCTLEAAAAVCGDGADEITVLDLLSSLSDKSLVIAETGGERERYRLLESTRAYALEKLAAAGELERLSGSHAAYFRDQAKAADERYGTGSTFAWVAQVEQELDNYRTALQWGLSQGHDAVVGGEIAGALDRFWRNAGLSVEGRYWITLALKGLSETEHPKVAARLWRAMSYSSSGKEAYEAARRARQLYESVGDELRAARAQRSCAFGLNQMGRLEEAEHEASQAFATSTRLSDACAAADACNVRGLISIGLGDTAKAREFFAQAFAAYESLGNEHGVALVLGNRAELEFAAGNPSEAMELAEKGLAILVRGKESPQLLISRANIAAYYLALGELDAARDSAREGLRLARNNQSAMGSAINLQHLAFVGAMQGEVRVAARLVGYVDAQFKAFGMEREATERWGYEKLMAALREKLSEDEIAKLAAEGAAWSEDQAVEEALKL